MLSSSHWKWRGDWHNDFSTTKTVHIEPGRKGGKATGSHTQKRKAGSQAWRSSLGSMEFNTPFRHPSPGVQPGKMSPLAGLKSGRAYWEGCCGNQDSPSFEVCMHAQTSCISTPNPTCLPAPAQWRGSRLEIAWYSGWLASTLPGLHWGPAPALLALAPPPPL